MTPPQPARDTLHHLRAQLRHCLLAYYAQDAPVRSDADYDRLVAQVRALEQAQPRLRDWDSPDVRVEAPVQDAFPERRHALPMLSLANVYSVEELRAWAAGLQRLLPPQTAPRYVAELKIDGLAISIRYEQGRLAAAVTRGDGTSGEEVTRNMRTVRGLPHTLPEPLTLEVRGEVYYPLSQFQRLNEERERQGEPAFKNPRNAAAGTLRMLDSTIVGQRNLQVAVYALAVGPTRETHTATMGWLRGLGLPVSDLLRPCATLQEVEDFYAHWFQARHALDFQIDGVVVKLDDLALREAAGSTSKSPRWACALKFATERVQTTLEDVEVGVGRTGVLTPIAHLKPVQLGGTTVSRATLHNYDQIARLDLQLGDAVYVEKGGEIIPKVVGVDLAARAAGSHRPIAPPAACPSCGMAPLRLEDEVDYHCPNPLCPAQQQERILHFVSRKAMDIEGVGPALVELLVAEGLVSSYADLYRLTVEQVHRALKAHRAALAEQKGTAAARKAGPKRKQEEARQPRNIIEAIESSKTRPLERFLHALGIRYVGERTAQLLARRFGALEALRQAGVEELEDINEIGAVTAASVHGFFHDPQQWELIARCLEAGVAPVAPAAAGGGGALTGKTVVITGTLTVPRGRWKETLEAAGATVTGSVSSRTDYVLAGENPGSKLDKARALNVAVLGEDEMNRLLAGA
ncbi:MAG: NAD-dependent DNA ligase LigA [Candidatus Lambdaproteobacteria bacterium]|nr:NAD-dependent DNA ligase LigA [Candidatus Lambdaproteobacteria bacterium]